MNNPVKIMPLACVMLAAMSCIAAQPAQAQSADTSFFVTSNGVGNGGNLGGLAGADNQCQTLAQAAGAGGKTWRAYLSTQAADGKPAVNARDRIGLRDDDASKSWNSSHPSRGPDGGCSQADLKSTGGDGLMYCFAAN